MSAASGSMCLMSILLLLSLSCLSHQTPIDNRNKLLLQKVLQLRKPSNSMLPSSSSSSSSSARNWLDEEVDEDEEDDEQNQVKRAPGSMAAFWKRGAGGENMDSFWKRSYDDDSAFWKRAPSTADAFWKRGVGAQDMDSFWKRAGSMAADQELETLLRALATIRDYIEKQKQQPAQHPAGDRQNKAHKGSSYEVIDANTNLGELALATQRKEEHRRDNPIMQPEFNPTGW